MNIGTPAGVYALPRSRYAARQMEIVRAFVVASGAELDVNGWEPAKIVKRNAKNPFTGNDLVTTAAVLDPTWTTPARSGTPAALAVCPVDTRVFEALPPAERPPPF